MKGSKEAINNSSNGKKLQGEKKNAEMPRILSELEKMEAERSQYIPQQG